MMFRLAQDNDISKQPHSFYIANFSELQNSFFQMVCPCCFSFFLPGINCFPNLYAMKRIRRLKSKSHRASKNIKIIIFTSQLFGDKANLKSESIVTTINCKACKSLIVHDLSSLEFSEKRLQQPLLISKPTSTVPKKDNLQKALQKSQISKSNDPQKKELDLESFLQGFL